MVWATAPAPIKPIFIEIRDAFSYGDKRVGNCLERESAVDVEVLSRNPDGAWGKQEDGSFCYVRWQAKATKRNHSSSSLWRSTHRAHEFVANNVASRRFYSARRDYIDANFVWCTKFLRESLSVIVHRGLACAIVNQWSAARQIAARRDIED